MKYDEMCRGHVDKDKADYPDPAGYPPHHVFGKNGSSVKAMEKRDTKMLYLMKCISWCMNA